MGDPGGDSSGDCAHFSVSALANAVFKILASVDRLAMLAASSATSAVFRGDRIADPGLKDATFFNIAVVLVTGFQTALLGAFIGAILSRKHTPKT